MIISLSMYFDDEEYSSNYPDLSEDNLIRMFKEDFVETIRKEWNDEEIIDSLEVSYE